MSQTKTPHRTSDPGPVPCDIQLMSDSKVAIIGGGLAGLAAAKALKNYGIPFTLFEASKNLGGRVQSDRHDGFILDHGFQVLLPAYPEAQAQLDLEALDLRGYLPGAIVFHHHRASLIADPFRKPSAILSTAFSSVGSFADKLKVLALRSGSKMMTYEGPSNVTALQGLRNAGFSDKMIDRFFRPFYGGIFLTADLNDVPYSFLQYLFRFFSESLASIPKNGMAEIPTQMAADLPADSLRLRTPVQAVDVDGTIHGLDGSKLQFDHVILAVQEPAAHRLLKANFPTPIQARSSQTLYFSADIAPIDEPYLVINGNAEGSGHVNHVAVPSLVQPNYAPKGKHLIAVNAVGRDAHQMTAEKAIHEVTPWFGNEARAWKFLSAKPVYFALPRRFGSPELKSIDKVTLAGDFLETPSIQGALLAGRKAGEALALKLGGSSR